MLNIGIVSDQHGLVPSLWNLWDGFQSTKLFVSVVRMCVGVAGTFCFFVLIPALNQAFLKCIA